MTNNAALSLNFYSEVPPSQVIGELGWTRRWRVTPEPCVSRVVERPPPPKKLGGLRRQQIAELEAQQSQVQTGPEGDPDHGYATIVAGWLRPITGIGAYGIAAYKDGSWRRIT